MEKPNIKYFISTQQFPKTGKLEMILAKINKSETDYEAIVVVPAKNDNKLNGSNIVFSEDGVAVSNEKKYKLDDLAVGMDGDEPYLYLEKFGQKLWHLPWEVVDFLEMNIIKENYGLTIIDDKPYIVKSYIRNTCNPKIKVSFKKELILRKHEDSLGYACGDEKKDKKNRTSKFVLFESDDQNEKMNQTYFELYNSKYYLKECWVQKNKEMIGVYSKCKVDGEICENAACCLGYTHI